MGAWLSEYSSQILVGINSAVIGSLITLAMVAGISFFRKNGIRGIKANIGNTKRNFLIHHMPKVAAHRLYKLFSRAEKDDPKKFPKGMKLGEEMWLLKQLENPGIQFRPGEKEYLTKRIATLQTPDKEEMEKLQYQMGPVMEDLQRMTDSLKNLPPR